MLEYDDSAFYYFTLALLSFYILPGTYFLIFHQVWPAIFPGEDPLKVARTEVSDRTREGAGCTPSNMPATTI
jgi:hypothetical protein